MAIKFKKGDVIAYKASVSDRYLVKVEKITNGVICHDGKGRYPAECVAVRLGCFTNGSNAYKYSKLVQRCE